MPDSTSSDTTGAAQRATAAVQAMYLDFLDRFIAAHKAECGLPLLAVTVISVLADPETERAVGTCQAAFGPLVPASSRADVLDLMKETMAAYAGKAFVDPVPQWIVEGAPK
jgi:hypothetical protein